MPVLNSQSADKYGYDNMKGNSVKNVGKPKNPTDGMTFAVPSYTTAERDALPDITNGEIIYNTTTNAFNFYENGSWVTK